MSSEESTILVLGGGIGGVSAALDLRRLLPPAHRVVLFERHALHTYRPSIPWVMVGTRHPAELQRPVADLSRAGIEVVQGEVARIDPQERRVSVGERRWRGDYLVVALGAVLAPPEQAGLAEAGRSLYSLQDVARFQEERKELRSGHLAVVVAALPLVCPSAPYEMAMLLAYDAGKRGVSRTVTISLFTPEAGPLAAAGARASSGARRLLEERGVELHPQHEVTAVEPSAGLIHFQGARPARYDLLAYVPAQAPPPLVQAAGLGDGDGWVPVDRHTLETSFPGVYAVGDVAVISLANGIPLPRTALFAQRQAEVVAQNIARELTGDGQPARFDGTGTYVIDVGGGRASLARGNFYAEPAPTVRPSPASFHGHTSRLRAERAWFERWP